MAECRSVHGVSVVGVEIAEDSTVNSTDKEKIYDRCFERIAKAIGVETGLQITAEAQNDDETSAEILTRMVEKFVAGPAITASRLEDAAREFYEEYYGEIAHAAIYKVMADFHRAMVRKADGFSGAQC